MQIQIISTAGHAEAPAARLGPPIRAVAGIEPAEPSASQRRQGPQRDRPPVLSLLGVPVKTCHQPQTSTSWGFRRQVADDVVALLGTNEGPGGISRDLPAEHLSCQTGRFVTDGHSSAVVRHALSAVRSGQGCLGGHQVSRADPGCSVRLPLAWASTGVDCGRGSVRSDCCPSRAIGKDRCCGGPFRRALQNRALQKEPPDVCPVSRIGHLCGNLHRAGLTGPAARGTAARP